MDIAAIIVRLLFGVWILCLLICAISLIRFSLKYSKNDLTSIHYSNYILLLVSVLLMYENLVSTILCDGRLKTLTLKFYTLKLTECTVPCDKYVYKWWRDIETTQHIEILHSRLWCSSFASCHLWNHVQKRGCTCLLLLQIYKESTCRSLCVGCIDHGFWHYWKHCQH